MNTGIDDRLIIFDPDTQPTTCNKDLNIVSSTANSCGNDNNGGGSGSGGAHNNLSGLQGGLPTERYHVTKAEWEAIHGADSPSGTNVFATIDDIPNPTVPGDYIQNQIANAQAASFWINGTAQIDSTLTVGDSVNHDDWQITGDGNSADINALKPNGISINGVTGDKVMSVNDANTDGTNPGVRIFKDTFLSYALPTITGSNYQLVIQDNSLQGKLSGISLSSTVLVTPVIVPTWTLNKANSTPYSPATSAAKNITVDVGVVASLTAIYSYPNPGTGQGLPTSVSGSFGTTLAPPATNSVPLVVASILGNTSYSVTLSKPKSGLIVTNNQVTVATGNDTTSDSISITYSNKIYYGTTTKNGTSQPILDADVLGVTSEFKTNRAKVLTNFGGGTTRILIGIPTAFGTASFKVNGLANTAFTKVRSNTDFVNAGGGTIKLDVYISDNIYNSPLDTFEIT